MDRRQRKTRQAIFEAFTELLLHKKGSAITVGEIIEKADVGRATFYAHFETKDYLVKELCKELFCHIFDSADGNTKGHNHIFECNSHEDIFLHLLRHLEANDNGITTLLMCDNNEFFLEYFKNELEKLVKCQGTILAYSEQKNIPLEYWVNHVSGSFVETVGWWLSHGKRQTPEKIHEYFLTALGIGERNNNT